MKIISSQGNEINFKISGNRNLVIGTEPVEVTDLEYRVIEQRLGFQIKLVVDDYESADDVLENETVSPETAKVEEVADTVDETADEVIEDADALDEDSAESLDSDDEEIV